MPCLHHRQIGKPRGIAQAQPISVHFPVISKQFGGKFQTASTVPAIDFVPYLHNWIDGFRLP